MSYDKVQERHRRKSKHHIEYFVKHGTEKTDWLAMAIDWECSRLTKRDAPRNAADTLIMMKPLLTSQYKLDSDQVNYFCQHLRRVLNKYGINEPTTYFSRPIVANRFIARQLRYCVKVTVADVDWTTAVRYMKLSRLIKNDGRDKDVYITPDGASYVIKHNCNQSNECSQLLIFSYHEPAFGRAITSLSNIPVGCSYKVLTDEQVKTVKENLLTYEEA